MLPPVRQLTGSPGHEHCHDLRLDLIHRDALNAAAERHRMVTAPRIEAFAMLPAGRRTALPVLLTHRGSHFSIAVNGKSVLGNILRYGVA